MPADDHQQPSSAKIGDTPAAIGGAARTGLLIVLLAFLGTGGLAGRRPVITRRPCTVGI